MENPHWHQAVMHFARATAAVDREELIAEDDSIIIKERDAIKYALEQNDRWRSVTANFVLNSPDAILTDVASGISFKLDSLPLMHAFALLELAMAHCPEFATDKEFFDLEDKLVELEKEK